jgi:hypothetical protein
VQWHNTFRVALNSASLSDLGNEGDRILACWVSKNPQVYYFSTYTYTDLNGNGNPDIHQGAPYTYYLPLWHFIYFGYSRQDRRAFAFIQFRDSQQTLNWASTDHYLTPKFSIFVGGDFTYQSFSGSMAFVNFNMGPGAFRTSLNGLTPQNDQFGFYLGVQNFTVPKNPNPLVNASASLFPSDHLGSNAIEKTWGATELGDTSEFGYCFWARSLMTYPSRIWQLPGPYYAISLF